MQQKFTLSGFSAFENYSFNSQYTTDSMPYTIVMDIPLKCSTIDQALQSTVNLWAAAHIDRDKAVKNINKWLTDIIQSGCDITGIWGDGMIINGKEIYIVTLRQLDPPINIRVIFRKTGETVDCSIYITFFDIDDYWGIDPQIYRILELFSFQAKDPKGEFSIRFTMREAWQLNTISTSFKLFNEIQFRPIPQIHIPEFMFGNPNDVWNIKIRRSNEDNPNGKKITETIKTPKGTFNITRTATKKETEKAAKKIRRERLQDKVTRQDKDIETLRQQVKDLQKEYQTLYQSNAIATSKRNREIEDLQKRLGKLKQSKENAIAQKDIEISEIQKVADEIVSSIESSNMELQNENSQFNQQLQNASWHIQSLQDQVESLRRRSSGNGILLEPPETQKFNSEFEIAIMSALHFAKKNIPIKANSFSIRSRDFWDAIIRANPAAEKNYQIYSQNVQYLQTAIRKNSFWKSQNLLAPLGLKCEQYANNHGKIRFMDGDERYSGTVASTPSETLAGPSNCADELRNAFFYPV